MTFNRNNTRSNIFTWLWPASLVTILTPRGRTEGQGEKTFAAFAVQVVFMDYIEKLLFWGSKDRIPGCHFPKFGVFLFRDSTGQLFLSENSRNCY